MREWFSRIRRRFEIERGGKNNLNSMQGLRGFAVLLVFLVHYFVLGAPWLAHASITYTLADLLESLGQTGVDLFFVLSGYLIYSSLMRRARPFLAYIARRLERIYPTFLAVFVIYLALSFIFPAENKIPHTPSKAMIYLLQNLLLLPGIFPIRRMIAVSWSLSYEMLYYLSIPLLISILRLRAWSRIQRVGFFLALAACLATLALNMDARARLAMFISGILLYEALASGLLRSPINGSGLAALALGFTLTLALPGGGTGFLLKLISLFVSFFILCLDSFSNQQGLTARIFSCTPLRWLGNMSYSYYLTHGLTLQAIFLGLNLVFPPRGDQTCTYWIFMPLFFLATLIPSAALYLLVEWPLSLMPARWRKIQKPVSWQKTGF
ncbi:MAG: acyltransferase [Anaerolineales bacterium]|nr:acyltransferase [Anaerolineales bacterium]